MPSRLKKFPDIGQGYHSDDDIGLFKVTNLIMHGMKGEHYMRDSHHMNGDIGGKVIVPPKTVKFAESSMTESTSDEINNNPCPVKRKGNYKMKPPRYEDCNKSDELVLKPLHMRRHLELEELSGSIRGDRYPLMEDTTPSMEENRVAPRGRGNRLTPH